MRGAVAAALAAGRMSPRSLIGGALVRFERAVANEAPGGVRPSLLFAERDRIVTELGCFLRSRLLSRLVALRRRDLVAVGAAAAPFDALVRGRGSKLYAVLLRRLPTGGRRLEGFGRIRKAARSLGTHRCDGVVIYDLSTGRVTRVPCTPVLAGPAQWLGPAA